jgi:AraC-like DNA-binding protein
MINMVPMNPEETIPYLKDYFFAPYITLAHTFNAPEHWGLENRTLKQYALQYVLKGAAEYEIEGTVYTTRQGDLIVHRPYELHSIRTIKGEPYLCISLVFHFGSSPFPLDALIGQGHYCGNYANHLIERQLTQLVTSYQLPGLDHHARCQGLLLQILSELPRGLTESHAQSDVQHKKRNKLILIRNHIINHFHQTIDYKKLESISGLSQSYIIAQFKQTFGLSPVQFQIHIRIQKAKELALQTGHSIGEIAGMVGYSDVHTFGRIFKKKTGYSMTEFCATLCL